MSVAERLSRARCAQGKFTDQELKDLKEDCFQLLDGKKHSKSERQIKQELVKFCGWSRPRIFGPHPYVVNCLERLEEDCLAESEFEVTVERSLEWFTVTRWWKK